ncbi:hypothetical protein Dcar01_01089 [Deinococcus carri]|uniref:Uncharacterized protein n=1 Tax=Deinococcus carri TaxID=1211323 RepID=A0ABP9W7B5_9DEIO
MTAYESRMLSGHALGPGVRGAGLGGYLLLSTLIAGLDALNPSVRAGEAPALRGSRPVTGEAPWSRS